MRRASWWMCSGEDSGLPCGVFVHAHQNLIKLFIERITARCSNERGQIGKPVQNPLHMIIQPASTRGLRAFQGLSLPNKHQCFGIKILVHD
jgi:hypothetical protein